MAKPLKLGSSNLPEEMGADDAIPMANLPVIATNAQTGTSYTLASSDAGGRVTMDNADTNTVTIDASVLTVGSGGLIQQTGAGTTSVEAADGTTIVQGGPTLNAAQQGAVMFWLCDSDTQVTIGGTVAAS